MCKKIKVSHNGSGDYCTVSEALNAAAPGDIIYIMNGIYEEKIYLDKAGVTVEGESAEGTVITYGDYAKKTDSEGKSYGTFRTAAFRTNGDNITLKNLTIINSAGNGRDYGQAIALYAEGDSFRCMGCRLIASQDTLFAAPHPQKAKDTAVPRARHFYKNCYIRGDIDFIFGGATAFFDNCEIFSQDNITEEDIYFEEKHTKGFAAAACTWEGVKYGFVFENCRFTGDCGKETVYIGRPWRQYARTVLINCELGEHIKKEGFHDWDKPEAHTDAYYAEYHSFGKGACESERADWIHILTDSEAKEYDRHKVLDGMEGIE